MAEDANRQAVWETDPAHGNKHPDQRRSSPQPGSQLPACRQPSIAQVPCCWPAPAGLPASSDGASCKGSGRSPLWYGRFQPCFPAMASGQLRIWLAHPLADLSPQLGVVRRLHLSWLAPWWIGQTGRATSLVVGVLLACEMPLRGGSAGPFRRVCCVCCVCCHCELVAMCPAVPLICLFSRLNCLASAPASMLFPLKSLEVVEGRRVCQRECSV